MTLLAGAERHQMSAKQAAREAREIAIDTLDYIHSMKPETDPSITMQLSRIIRALRDENLGGE